MRREQEMACTTTAGAEINQTIIATKSMVSVYGLSVQLNELSLHLKHIFLT